MDTERLVALFREAVEAVAEGKVAEVDIEEELYGGGTVRVTIRRDPFRISSEE